MLIVSASGLRTQRPQQASKRRPERDRSKEKGARMRTPEYVSSHSEL